MGLGRFRRMRLCASDTRGSRQPLHRSGCPNGMGVHAGGWRMEAGNHSPDGELCYQSWNQGAPVADGCPASQSGILQRTDGRDTHTMGRMGHRGHQDRLLGRRLAGDAPAHGEPAAMCCKASDGGELPRLHPAFRPAPHLSPSALIRSRIRRRAELLESAARHGHDGRAPYKSLPDAQRHRSG